MSLPLSERIGRTGFPALLLQRRRLSRANLEVAEQHASRKRMELADATLPIVVLTAEEGPGVEERVLQLGADDYLLKPFDPAVLRSRVHAVFRRLKAVAA